MTHGLGIPTASVKIEDGRDGDIPLLIWSDVHLGSIWCDEQLVRRVMDFADEYNALHLLNGDLIENAIKHSCGNSFEQTTDPNGQMAKVRQYWGANRKGRVLACVGGNHEGRLQREADFDILKFWTQSEGIPYLERAGLLSLSVRGQNWVIFAAHGVRGTGRKAGSSVNAIHEMAEIADADLYVHGHHHQANFTKKLRANYKPGPGFYMKPSWFVNAGTFHRYGGYASDNLYPATDVGCYVLWLQENRARKGKNIRAEFLDRAYFGMSR